MRDALRSRLALVGAFGQLEEEVLQRRHARRELEDQRAGPRQRERERGDGLVAAGPDGAIAFRPADEAAVASLSRALAGAGAHAIELAPHMATLEDLFFDLTEDAGDADADDERVAHAAQIVEEVA